MPAPVEGTASGSAGSAPRNNQQSPVDSPRSADEVSRLLDYGNGLYAQRKLGESEAIFRQVIGSGKHVAAGFYGLGMARLALGDLEDAELQLRTAAQLNPQNANALYYLGTLGERRGARGEAMAFYNAALAINPQHAGAKEKLQGFPGTAPPGAERPTIGPSDGVLRGPQAPTPPGVRADPRRLPAARCPTCGSEQPIGARACSACEQPLSGPARPVAAPSTPADAPAQGPAPTERYGVYAFLLQDSSMLSKDTIALMDALRMRVHPTFTAYLDRFLSISLRFLILFALAFAAMRIGDLVGDATVRLYLTLLPVAVVALYWLAIAAQCFIISTTKITIDKGRLQIAEGILRRRVNNIELWRVRDISLQRTFLNQITRDGSLIINIVNESTVEIKGLARGSRLTWTFQQMLNLSFALRSHPVVKGIVS